MVIGGTGHRPDKLGGYSLEAFDKLKLVAHNHLLKSRPTLVISGVALGWDQALAWAAIDLNIDVLAAVPFPNQDAVWPTGSRIKYKLLLEKCKKVVVVSRGGFSGYKMQKRNEFIVDEVIKSNDNESHVLCMWDGTDGGTKNCLSYAKLNPKLKIVNLYDTWKQL